MSGKQFQRKIEDFICEHCNTQVKGNGYTNHCPNCLCSKHVDIQPGDRANPCGGLMKPTAIDKKGDQLIIIHTCQKCTAQMRCKSAKEDNFSKILDVMRGV